MVRRGGGGENAGGQRRAASQRLAHRRSLGAWQTRGVSAALRGAESKQVIPTALNGTTHKISLAIGCEPEMVVADVRIEDGPTEGGTHASDAALLLCVWSNAYRLK